MRRRPRHLVVFREVSEINIGLISKELNAHESKGLAASRASFTVLESANGSSSRVYSRLGVATADLTEDQQEHLRKVENIQSILPNELRFVPRPSPEAVDLAVGSSVPDGDPLSAYLQGMRDAIESVQRFRNTGSRTFSEFSLIQTDSGDSSMSWCLHLIGMDPHYNAATGKDVSVAVLDTGIDLNHPDLGGRIQEDVNTKSFIESESVQDAHGHGTHCAGIVAGPINSAGSRRYGVAPDVELIIGKVLDNQGYGYDDQILEGIDWAVDQGAKVISLSFVSELDRDREINGPFSEAYERVASVLLEGGVLLVAAAANTSCRPHYTKPVDNPAACPSIMAVAAVDRQKQIAPFSCAKMDDIGSVDISGPGVSVYSAWTGGRFASISGTSMATPHVAGVAALYRQLYPHLSAKELRQLVLASALPLGDPKDYGFGLVQVPHSVQANP